MDTKAVGTQHGAAVRRVVGYAADTVVALGKEVALNARRSIFPQNNPQVVSATL